MVLLFRETGSQTLFCGDTMMSKEIILKKKIFGGFNRRRVVECFAELQTEYADYDKHDEVLRLEEQINNLTARISEKDIELENLRNKLAELNSLSSQQNNSLNFNTLSQADRIIDDAKKEAEQYIKSADSYYKNSNKEFDLLMNKITELNREISEISSGATKISENLSKVSINDTSDDEIITSKAEPLTESPANYQNEEEILYEDDEADIFLSTESAEEDSTPSYNSIDNFFAELEKLIDGK